VGLHQTLENVARGAEAFQCVGQIAMRHVHVAEPVIRNRQIALPTGVAGVGLRQTITRAVSEPAESAAIPESANL
jgi:hypothetical protein